MANTSLAAVIMAAGQGKRMQNPDMAKVMHTLGGIPLVDHVIALARRCGASRIIVIVGHQREAVEAHLRAGFPEIEIAVQTQQLGTGHAVLQAGPLLADFDGDVMILSGDAPLTRTSTMARLQRAHDESGAAVTVLTAILPDPAGYGRVIRDGNGAILRIVEHKDASDEERAVREINSGIYLFRKGPLFDALARVRNDNAQGEYYLPDVFAMFAERKLHMEPCLVDSFDEIRGVNTVEQLQDMEHIYERMQDEAKQ